jgi:multiple sugar transport system substrate-binding protein
VRTSDARRLRRRFSLPALAAAAALALVVGCGGSDSGGDNEKAASKSADNGTTITMWTRAATQIASERLVKAYNASHKNKVS